MSFEDQGVTMDGVGIDSNCLVRLFVRLPGTRVGEYIHAPSGASWKLPMMSDRVVHESALNDVAAVRL